MEYINIIDLQSGFLKELGIDSKMNACDFFNFGSIANTDILSNSKDKFSYSGVYNSIRWTI